MKIDFSKHPDQLIPAIVQDVATKNVLMLGYMNQEALDQTQRSQKVTFFSRSKNRLWTKGETSENFLLVKEIKVDCDHDTLLVKAMPQGPTCHTGSDTCWNEANTNSYGFLSTLEAIISERQKNTDNENSYVASLFKKGINKIAQKVGEEAVETVIEAKDSNEDLFKAEAADLLFHYLILLKAKGLDLDAIVEVLKGRH